MRIIVLFLSLFFSIISKPKVLHLTFHEGSKSEVEELAKIFDFDLDSWQILQLPERSFDGISRNSHCYIMTEKRAADIYQKHKDTFASYDLIITSDIAPLCRIFLQHNWQKPLLVWVNNRFDFSIHRSAPFPDQKYLEMFQQAKDQENVEIIGYTPYEKVHAQTHRNITSIKSTIRPTGICTQQSQYQETQTTFRASKVFFRNYINERKIQLGRLLSRVGIPNYTGSFAGSKDIARFKAMVHIPCVMSNYFLYENLSLGVVHFIPTKRFYKQMYMNKQVTFFDWTNPMRRNDNIPIEEIFAHCEWYNDEYKDLFVFFDNFQELASLVKKTDYAKMKEIIMKKYHVHKKKTLSQWDKVFTKLLKKDL